MKYSPSIIDSTNRSIFQNMRSHIPTNVLNVAASYFATRGGKSIRSVEDVINSPAEVSADQPQSGKGDQP